MRASSAIRPLVIVAAVLAPVLSGAIIYYSLRRTRSDLAHLGNWVSAVSFFFLWPIALWSGLFQREDRLIPIALNLLGIGLAIVAVRMPTQKRTGLDVSTAVDAG